MKKISLIPLMLFLLSACAPHNEQLNNELNIMASEMHSMQLTVDELQNQVDDLSLKNDMLNAEVARSNQTIVDLETEMAYLNNEIILFKKKTPQSSTTASIADTPKTTPAGSESAAIPIMTSAEQPKTPKIIIIDETSGSKDNLYNYAFEQYRQGKYNESVDKFREFIQKYPGDTLANNSQYWIGENYYSMKNYNKALEEFQTVLSKYPKGSKVPDAMLKIGYCYTNVGQNEKAKDMFSNLIKNYPKSNSAKLAEQSLAKLK